MACNTTGYTAHNILWTPGYAAHNICSREHQLTQRTMFILRYTSLCNSQCLFYEHQFTQLTKSVLWNTSSHSMQCLFYGTSAHTVQCLFHGTSVYAAHSLFYGTPQFTQLTMSVLWTPVYTGHNICSMEHQLTMFVLWNTSSCSSQGLFYGTFPLTFVFRWQMACNTTVYTAQNVCNMEYFHWVQFWNLVF